MTKLAHRSAFTRFPEFLDFAESPWTAMLPFWPDPMFRIEHYAEDGRWVLRAELAGLDAEKNIDVTVQDRIMTIRAERQEEQRDGRRTEFRYGSLTRSVELPSRSQTDKITATYDKGILQISVPLADEKPTGHPIEIKTKTAK